MTRNTALSAEAIAIVALLGITLLAAPGHGAAPVPKPSIRHVRVNVEDNFFNPRSVEVAQGRRVVWVWKGANMHDVKFTKVPRGASHRGSSIRTDGRWRRSFSVPGVYRYVCTLYAGMRGTITVKPGLAESNRR